MTNLTELLLRGNPLSLSSINDHIPSFKRSGVTVYFDSFRVGSDFDIELVFLDDFTQMERRIIQYAARRWMSIIRGGLAGLYDPFRGANRRPTDLRKKFLRIHSSRARWYIIVARHFLAARFRIHVFELASEKK